MADQVLTYSGGWLNRAGNLRADPQWLQALRIHPATQVLPLWRDKCLVKNQPPQPVRLHAAAADAVLAETGDSVFLGLSGEVGIFAADLSRLQVHRAVELTGASAVLEVRSLIGSLSAAESATLAYARGLLHWHRNQQFCGVCGADTVSKNGGTPARVPRQPLRQAAIPAH